ncbi:MAG: 50S ribosomal protein L15 [Candidatus Levybacteria bacterium]|nr:50S ribosomal protein L15 [Candidatus Levybacteria bacterium]
MKLHDIKTISQKSKRRLGQGHGSGRVKTAGRGTKGQNARSSVPLSFEGGALPLIKRLPFLRGKGKNKGISLKPFIVNVKELNIFQKDSVVTVDSLIEKGIVKPGVKRLGVKILGDGKVEIPLKVEVPVSKQVIKIIEKAGGSVLIR